MLFELTDPWQLTEPKPGPEPESDGGQTKPKSGPVGSGGERVKMAGQGYVYKQIR